MAKLLILSCLAVFCSSCAAFVYAPNPLNMPLAKDKNEGKAKIYTGLNESGYQLSYSVINHVLIHTDGSYYDHQGESGSSMRTHVEGGIGLFQRIENNGCFEILGGYGYGMGRGGYTSSVFSFGPPENEVTSLNGYYQKIYIQPDIGFSHHNFDFGIGFRYAVLNVHNLTYSRNYVDSKTHQLYYGFYGAYNNNRINLIEPCINVGFGDGPLKMFISAGESNFQVGSPGNNLLNQLFLNYFVSLGITWNINRNWKE